MCATLKVTGIVFNSLYEASLFKHFEIIFDALRKTLSLEIFVLLVEKLGALFVFGTDSADTGLKLVFWCSIVSIWENTNLVWHRNYISS